MTPQEYGVTEVRAANLQDSERPTDKECFQAIDRWVREKEKEWVVVARACLEVQTRELWRHGNFHSWDEWLNNAAPTSARTIYWHIRIVRGLEADFTDAELATMPRETAKQLQRLPRSVRADPRVRRAANGKKRAFIATVQETHPEMHLENTEEIKLHLEASFVPLFHEVVEALRVIEDDPTMSYERVIELAFIAWMNEPWGEVEAGISNISRARQLQELAK